MPNVLTRIRRAISLGYQATQDKGRRQAPTVTLKNEDAQLTSTTKRRMDMTAQDMPRNFELAAWALRLHVAYVSRLRPHVATGNPDLDKVLTALLAQWSRRQNFDVAGRHDRDRAMSLFEIANVFYGDAAWLKLADGKIQAIPGVRIGKPNGGVDADMKAGSLWQRLTDRGLVLNPSTGAMEQACICRWAMNGYALEYDHFEPAQNLIYNGYFTDYDQTRGSSPLASCLNRCRDIAECLEYTNLKVKLHALLGVAFGSDSATGWMPPSTDGTEATTTDRPKYKVDLSQGLMVFNLAPGDTVNTIESKVPTTEFIDYTNLSVRLVLLAFDIPYTFLDSSASSFSARIADSNQYEFLAEEKRAKNAAVLSEWADWRIALEAQREPLRGALAAAGVSPEAASAAISWVGTETPWIDQLKQLQGDQLAIGLQLDSIPRICRKRGLDWRRNVDENAEVIQYAESKGAQVIIGQPGQQSATADETAPPAKRGTNGNSGAIQ